MPNKLMNNRSVPQATIIPVLRYEDVRQAAEWLCSVFGFTERLQIGTHRAQLSFGDGAVIVAERHQDMPEASPAQPFTGHSTHVRLEDIDRHYEHARANGARILNPPTDYPYGERQYEAIDLGGHRWTFTQTLADVDPASWGGTLLTNA
jgi:uncharacterized glyoxalase superfamily protein PhnB